MTFDNLTLIGVFFILPYIFMLVVFSKTKSVSRRNTTPITDHFINKAIQYRHRGDVTDQPVPGPCRSWHLSQERG